MWHRRTGIEFQRALEFPLRTCPVPVIRSFDLAKSSVSFSELVINLQRPQGCCFGFWVCFPWRKHTVTTEQAVGVSQTSVGDRVTWVLGNCLLEVFGALFQPCLSP